MHGFDAAFSHFDGPLDKPFNVACVPGHIDLAARMERILKLIPHFVITEISPLEDELSDASKVVLLRGADFGPGYVDQSIVDRPKQGFEPPLVDWLRGPLKGWADDLLSWDRIKDTPYYNAKIVQSRWQDHRSGKRAWTYSLWTVLMFEAWLEKQQAHRA